MFPKTVWMLALLTYVTVIQKALGDEPADPAKSIFPDCLPGADIIRGEELHKRGYAWRLESQYRSGTNVKFKCQNSEKDSIKVPWLPSILYEPFNIDCLRITLELQTPTWDPPVRKYECVVKRFLRINVIGTGVDYDMVWIDWELKDAFAFHYLEGIDAVLSGHLIYRGSRIELPEKISNELESYNSKGRLEFLMKARPAKYNITLRPRFSRSSFPAAKLSAIPKDVIFEIDLPDVSFNLHCGEMYNKFQFSWKRGNSRGPKRLQWKCWHANLTTTEGEEELPLERNEYSNRALFSCCKVVGTLFVNKTFDERSNVKYDDPGILMYETVTCNAPYVHSLISRKLDYALVLHWKTGGKECVRSITYVVRQQMTPTEELMWETPEETIALPMVHGGVWYDIAVGTNDGSVTAQRVFIHPLSDLGLRALPVDHKLGYTWNITWNKAHKAVYGTDVTIICNQEERYNYKNVTSVYYDPFNSKCSGYASGYFQVLLKFVNPFYQYTPHSLKTFPDVRRVFLKLNSGENYANDSAWVSWEIQKQPPDYDIMQHFDGRLFVTVTKSCEYDGRTECESENDIPIEKLRAVSEWVLSRRPATYFVTVKTKAYWPVTDRLIPTTYETVINVDAPDLGLRVSEKMNENGSTWNIAWSKECDQTGKIAFDSRRSLKFTCRTVDDSISTDTAYAEQRLTYNPLRVPCIGDMNVSLYCKSDTREWMQKKVVPIRRRVPLRLTSGMSGDVVWISWAMLGYNDLRLYPTLYFNIRRIYVTANGTIEPTIRVEGKERWRTEWLPKQRPSEYEVDVETAVAKNYSKYFVPDSFKMKVVVDAVDLNFTATFDDPVLVLQWGKENTDGEKKIKWSCWDRNHKLVKLDGETVQGLMYKVELPPSCFTAEAELVVNASRIYKQEKHYIILKDSVALDRLPRKLKIINISSRVYDYMVELNWDVEGKEFFSQLSFLVTRNRGGTSRIYENITYSQTWLFPAERSAANFTVKILPLLPDSDAERAVTISGEAVVLIPVLDLGLRIQELQHERGYLFNISWSRIERFRKMIISKCAKIEGGNHSFHIDPVNGTNSVIVEPFDLPCVTNLFVTLYFLDHSKNEVYTQTEERYIKKRLTLSLRQEINGDIVAISWIVVTPFNASLFPALAYEVRRTLALDEVETVEPAVTTKNNHVEWLVLTRPATYNVTVEPRIINYTNYLIPTVFREVVNVSGISLELKAAFNDPVLTLTWSQEKAGNDTKVKWSCSNRDGILAIEKEKSIEGDMYETEVPPDCYKVKARLYANRTRVDGKKTNKILFVDSAQLEVLRRRLKIMNLKSSVLDKVILEWFVDGEIHFSGLTYIIRRTRVSDEGETVMDELETYEKRVTWPMFKPPEKYIVEVTPMVVPSDLKRLEEAISASTTIYVQEFKPKISPSNVKVVLGQAPTEYTITFNPLDPSDIPGKDIGCIVRIDARVPREGDQVQVCQERILSPNCHAEKLPPRNSSAVYTSLTPEKTYYTAVACGTNAGLGPYSKWISFFTYYADVALVVTDGLNTVLRWSIKKTDGLPVPEKHIKGLQVILNRRGTSSPFVETFLVTEDTSLREIDIGLSPGYKFELKCYSYELIVTLKNGAAFSHKTEEICQSPTSPGFVILYVLAVSAIAIAFTTVQYFHRKRKAAKRTRSRAKSKPTKTATTSKSVGARPKKATTRKKSTYPQKTAVTRKTPR